MKLNLCTRRLAAAAAVIAVCAVCWAAVRLIYPPSIHKEAPTAEIVSLTMQTQYPPETEKLVVRVENRGDYTGEIYKPYLEREGNGRWYIVKKAPSENETSNLLYVPPGETAEFEVYLSGYDLKPGQYRAVFDFVQDEEYFAFSFEIVE